MIIGAGPDAYSCRRVDSSGMAHSAGPQSCGHAFFNGRKYTTSYVRGWRVPARLTSPSPSGPLNPPPPPVLSIPLPWTCAAGGGYTEMAKAIHEGPDAVR
jgi:hypothetical protein